VRNADYQEIVERLARDFPAEHDACVALARSGGSLPLEALRNQSPEQPGSTLRHLLGYQIAAVEGARVFLTIELLTRWLRQRHKDDA